MASPAGGIIEATGTIRGTLGPLRIAGAPVAGTNEVQTLTLGGTPTGGTFKLTFGGLVSAAITWSATNATLLANIQAALDAFAALGATASQVVATAGTLTAGIGTVVLTFSGSNVSARNMGAAFGTVNNLTGTAPTLAVARTTPGVDVSFRAAAIGALLEDTTNGLLYQNTTFPVPTWGKVGVQS